MLSDGQNIYFFALHLTYIYIAIFLCVCGCIAPSHTLDIKILINVVPQDLFRGAVDGWVLRNNLRLFLFLKTVYLNMKDLLKGHSYDVGLGLPKHHWS